MYVRYFLFLALSVLAWSNLASSEPGFWPIEHAKVPEKVRDASRFVFQVSVPVASKHQIEYSKIEATKRDLATTYQSGKISQAHYLLLLQELDRCLKNENQDYFCTISSEDIGGGTIFSLGNQQVATALHVVAPFLRRMLEQSEVKELSESQQLRFLQQVRIPVVIEESVGQYRRVYLTINTLTKAAFNIIKDEANTKFFHKLFSDAIILNVDGMDVGSGLKIAKSTTTTAEHLYALGFPNQTTNRHSYFNVPDADGYGLRVTIGEKRDFIRFFNELVEFKGIEKVAELTSDEKSYVSRMHFVATDLNSGMSGGPLLNLNGEVVGVVHSLVPIGHSGVDEILGHHSVSVCMKYLMRTQL